MPAARKQYREINRILDEGVYGTADPQGKLNVFRQYQQAGLLPEGFDDPRSLTDYLRSLLEQGKTKKEALKQAKVTLGASFFDKAGNIVGRKIRNEIGPALEKAWDLTEPYFFAKDLGALERQGWAENQKELREVGERLGIKLDIGHFDTSASGAPQNIRAAGAEYAKANQAAGSSPENPERPITAQERLDTGVASNKVQGLSETGLHGMGVPARSGTQTPLNPYISVLLGTNLKGNSSRLLSGKGLEQLNRTFQDFEDQGLNPVAMYDYLRSKGGEELTDLDIQEMAKAGEEKYRYSKYNPNRPPEPMPTTTLTKPRQQRKQVQQEVIKVIPRGVKQNGGTVKFQRKMVRNLAAAGIGSFSALGTAASAVETGMRAQMASESFQRGDIVGGIADLVQTALSGASTAADLVPGVGEVVSTPADIANYLFDTARESAEAMKDPKIRAEDTKAYQKAMKPKPQPKPQPKPKPKPKPTRDKAAEARQRGGRMTIGPVTLPELGISEMLGIN